MEIVDRKFKILAVNPVNKHFYTEADSLLLCAKDAAVPAALRAYREECVRLGAGKAHVTSVDLLIGRVLAFQEERGGARVPDTVGEEIERCIDGKGIE